MMASAAKTAGAAVYRKETADDYFDRSDNYSFALAGVVAHTVVVAFEFPDYHAVSDEADKIDYANLAKVDRGIAAGVAAVANATETPKWSDTKATRVYRDGADFAKTDTPPRSNACGVSGSIANHHLARNDRARARQ